MSQETKLFEVRDRMTFIPVVATKLHNNRSEPTISPQEDKEHYLLGRAGWGPNQSLVLYHPLSGSYDSRAEIDPYKWGHTTNRTHFNAHKYIQDHWDELYSGDVVDVEYILNEVDTPKKSERFIWDLNSDSDLIDDDRR